MPTAPNVPQTSAATPWRCVISLASSVADLHVRYATTARTTSIAPHTASLTVGHALERSDSPARGAASVMTQTEMESSAPAAGLKNLRNFPASLRKFVANKERTGSV